MGSKSLERVKRMFSPAYDLLVGLTYCVTHMGGRRKRKDIDRQGTSQDDHSEECEDERRPLIFQASDDDDDDNQPLMKQ